MTVAETLVVKLGARLSKFLLKTYLKDPAEAVGDDLVDIAKGKIESYLDRQEAKRQFERIGEKIVAQLLPLFEAEAQPHEINPDAVIDELAETLEGRISAEFFLARDLDSTKLLAELRRVRPLPKGQFSEAEIDLYDRSLAEAVRYIVEVAAKLPRFEATHVKESLQRLTRIEDVVGETARDVRKIKEWVALQEGDPESHQYETDYRLAVGRNLDYLELFGADLTPESRLQALSVAYVSLTLETVSGSEEGEPEPTPVENILGSLDQDSGRLLIRGEAGSGKSTLFRWAAIEAAQGKGNFLFVTVKGIEFRVTRIAARHPSTQQEKREVAWKDPVRDLVRYTTGADISVPPWRLKIPFLLRLRDCKAGALPAPQDFPATIAKELGSPPAAWVQSVLRAGRGLVLLDGIDEVPNLHRETTKKEIKALMGAYPDCFFLVSSRPEAVPEDWLADLGFREARVNPMSNLDRSRFIDKWHAAVAKELERMGKPEEDLPRLAEELKRQLPESPHVARLATNPLLCAMICALHRDRGQKLPESQSELCEALCLVLLHRRERESGLDLADFPEPYRSLTYQQKRFIVQEIAHFMVLNGESSISFDQAEQKVADALRSLAGQSEVDAKVVCTTVVERSGMLRETRPGYLDFIHNTFKEYLAGERFANSGDAGLLAKEALQTSWQQVVLFAVATPRQGFAQEVIRRLLDRANQTTSSMEKRTCQLLALRCRAAALLVERQLEVELDAIARKLFPPRNMGDAEALAAAGDMAVTFLAFRKGLKAREAAASIRTLRLIGTPRARSVLEGYMLDRRETVIVELCQAVNPLSLKTIQERLLAEVGLPEGALSQISDLTPLANLNNLQNLDLGGTAVTDLRPLSGLNGLQRLNLFGTPVKDLTPLSGLKNLRDLYLHGTQVADLTPLSGLNGLQSLDLEGTSVTDLTPLSGLNGLQNLNLARTRVTDLTPLSGLNGLQWLDLIGTRVTDLTPLSGLSGLRELVLFGTPTEHRSALSHLSQLQIYG